MQFLFGSVSGCFAPGRKEKGGVGWMRENASEKGLHVGRGHIVAEGDGGLYEYKCILLQHMPALWPIKCLVK